MRRSIVSINAFRALLILLCSRYLFHEGENQANRSAPLMKARIKDADDWQGKYPSACHAWNRQGNIDSMTTLLALGASVYAVNLNQETPLHIVTQEFRASRDDAVAQFLKVQLLLKYNQK